MPAATTDELLLSTFQRAMRVPAYRLLLKEAGVDPAAIVDAASFAARCPILTKANTFDRFSIEQLCVPGMMADLADVLTSSGYGGRFSFGLSTRQQHAETTGLLDCAFDDAFQVKTRKTLAINCLPMGVTFSSHVMTVATTSVREDMAVALIKSFGSHYEQIMIVSDPLFVRRLLDHADEQGLDWRQYRVSMMLGEEIFGESFRTYVAGRLGLDVDRGDTGRIVSSFGVGELGLHLCYETPATIALRRAALRCPTLAEGLFGESGMAPAILAYNTQRTLIESIDCDSSGYGWLTVSMLDDSLPVPLPRYQTGDMVRLIDPKSVAAHLQRSGLTLPGDLPDALLVLRGRGKERLPDGTHVAEYKDALYVDREVADRLTGAFRLTVTSEGPRMHVQLARGAVTDAVFEGRLKAALRIGRADLAVVVSRYEAFPYGMGLDYERKFAYYATSP